MPAFTPPNDVHLTVSELNKATTVRTLNEVDDAMLRQIQRIVPATIAGFSEWTGAVGPHLPHIWVRWNWYFDDVLEDYIVSTEGFASNITLICPTHGTPLPLTHLFRLALRQIKRDVVWVPHARRNTSLTRQIATPPHATLRAGPNSPPIASRLAHRDGTAVWGELMVQELAKRPEDEQFDQIAKMARLKFDFDQTLLHCRSTINPSDSLIDENHPPAWREVYEKEQFIRKDPRLHMDGGSWTWAARELRDSQPDFWDKAMHHGVACGVTFSSADGLSALVLSRSYGAVTAEEMELIAPSLQVVAAFAHRLIRRRLHGDATPSSYAEGTLPPLDCAILRLLSSGKHRKEIAPGLGISMSSLDRRIKDIKSALGADTMPAAITEAQRLRIV